MIGIKFLASASDISASLHCFSDPVSCNFLHEELENAVVVYVDGH